MDSLLSASATEIAEMILSRRVSSVEVVTANLERIKTVNPDLNAVVQLCEERALSEAAACDTELLQGKTRGLLHGVPFTLKDSHDTEGSSPQAERPADPSSFRMLIRRRQHDCERRAGFFSERPTRRS